MKKIYNIIRLIILIFTTQKYKDYLGFAQAGEDKIVKLLLYTLGLKKATYLEIGTNHPIHFNNTYLLYLGGSRGVCVEANPNLIANIKRSRPEDVCLNVGIGKENSEAMDFYIFDGLDEAKGLSTFSKAEVEHVEMKSNIRVGEVKKIPVITINEIFSKYFLNAAPHFISIDVEGLDFEIIQSINFENYRPTVFCVETVSFLSNTKTNKKNEIINYFISNDYFVYAETGINTIFVDIKQYNVAI